MALPPSCWRPMMSPAAGGAKPLAKLVGQAGAALAPEWFTIAPAPATKRLLEKIGWRAEDVDLFEINEAFAAVVIGVCRNLGISFDRVNVHGGAAALGHPVGCSGARILTTLLYAMTRHNAGAESPRSASPAVRPQPWPSSTCNSAPVAVGIWIAHVPSRGPPSAYG